MTDPTILANRKVNLDDLINTNGMEAIYGSGICGLYRSNISIVDKNEVCQATIFDDDVSLDHMDCALASQNTFFLLF